MDDNFETNLPLEISATTETRNLSLQNQLKTNTTNSSSDKIDISVDTSSSHCNMTNKMPTTTTTILTNVHPSAPSSESTGTTTALLSASLAMTSISSTSSPTSFADCISAASSATTTAVQSSPQTLKPQPVDETISNSVPTVLLNGPILSNLSGSANSFNNTINNKNNTIDSVDTKLSTTEFGKSSDYCLSSPSNLSNGGNGSVGGLASPTSILIPSNSSCGYSSNPEQGSGSAMWSNMDDGSHISLNGYNNYQHFTNSPMFNGASASIAAAISQHNRRAITASHSGYQHMQHGLSPNSLNRSNPMIQTQNMQQQQQQQQQHQQQQQQQQQQQPQKQGGFNNNYTAWSNPPPSVAWSSGQPQNMQSWNRGRSVPNLNPMSNIPNRKPTSPNPGLSPSMYSSQQQQQQQHSVISPAKYRRSTSFPGKLQGQNAYSGSLEISSLEDGRDPYMQQYQDRVGIGNGLDMRSLEHCLSDIMRGVGDNGPPPDHHKGKPFFQGIEDHISEEAGSFVDGPVMPLSSPARSSPQSQGSEVTERFSRKVFVGGLPPDIDEEEITSSFRRFGPLVVDWPHKAESKSYFPPKGYAFLLFQDESSVQQLIEACITDEDKLYLCVSSPTIKDKPVQIRPWRLSDADFVLDASMPLDPRKTVFVGGVPRPLKAAELAMIMDRLYGGVCYAGIDTDPELKYPKGAGRVAFSNQQSYIAAISARFVQLQHGDIDKRVEVKPYVLDDQMCDECQGQRCSGKFAPFFCANVTCLQYYCEHCWTTIHSRPGREYHKPLVKEGADRPRAVPFRWC